MEGAFASWENNAYLGGDNQITNHTMKKSLWWVMLAAATVSCSEIDPQIPSSEAAGESSSFSVPIDLARHFAKVSNDDNPLVSEFPFVDGRDTLCYVFNYERGWAIVAADRRVPPRDCL